MNIVLRILIVLASLLVLLVLAVVLLTPWMDRWGATDQEIAAAYPGDELIPQPAGMLNRAITIQATPEQIYPWIAQLGADKGGMYSYTWLENLIQCHQTNADRIHPEWQDLQAGHLVRMCPEGFGPIPFTVALVDPPHAIVMGHQDNGTWTDIWQFIIDPTGDGASRLILRTRTNLTGGLWSVIHPGVFVMERGMLLGIRQRAEALASQSSE
jgi:hypothetical protein